MNALPEILFANCAAMELLGFNAQVLEDGICNTGHHSRKAGKKKPTPFSPQTVASVLARFSIEEAQALLDTLISLIARGHRILKVHTASSTSPSSAFYPG
ncbi:MAG: hypothetical protein QME92_05755 [Bacillota bacterium]|nr:hypothetical protein [Bacillota bacterium]